MSQSANAVAELCYLCKMYYFRATLSQEKKCLISCLVSYNQHVPRMTKFFLSDLMLHINAIIEKKIIQCNLS